MIFEKRKHTWIGNLVGDLVRQYYQNTDNKKAFNSGVFKSLVVQALQILK